MVILRQTLIALLTIFLCTASAASAQDIPSGYFIGFGSQDYENAHNWAQTAIVQSDGKTSIVPIRRYYDVLDSDLAQYKQAGATVMRAMLNVDAVLFWKECNWAQGVPYDVANSCYDRNYADASKAGWKDQISELDQIQNNPFVTMALDHVAKLETSGIHVILAPNDFFWGGKAKLGKQHA